jgi:hypothetical protein
MKCIYCGDELSGAESHGGVKHYYCSGDNHYYSYDRFIDFYIPDNTIIFISVDRLNNRSWKITYHNRELIKIIDEFNIEEVNKILKLCRLLK